MKVILALIVALVIVGGVIYAYGERNARISAERVAALEKQGKIDAERTAAQAEQSRIVAEDLAAGAEREKVNALQVAAKAEQTASQAEQSRIVAEDLAAEAEREKVNALQVAAKAEQAKADAEQLAAEAEQARTTAEEAAAEASLARVAAEQETAKAEEVAYQAERAKATAERTASREEQVRIAAESAAAAEEKARVLELAKTQPLIQAIVTGELKFYIEPLPWYAGEGTSGAVDDVAKSFSSWSSYNAKVQQVYNRADADLTVAWVRDYGSHVLGEAIFASHVKVGLGTNNCAGEWMAFDAGTIKKILWHELGHSMGYGHSRNTDNIMYERSDAQFVADQEISEVIAGGWYFTTPVCGSGTYYYSFETEDPSHGFDIFVLPPGIDPKSISAGGGRAYTDCSKRNMQRYSDSCTVAAGAKIYIRNTSYYEAIRLSGKIVDRNTLSWPDMKWDKQAFRYDSAQLRKYYNLFH